VTAPPSFRLRIVESVYEGTLWVRFSRMNEVRCLLGHTLWAVVLLCKDWRMQYGYSHNLWGYCIVLCNFRV